MWMACHTQEEIAAAVGEPLAMVKRLLTGDYRMPWVAL